MKMIKQNFSRFWLMLICICAIQLSYAQQSQTHDSILRGYVYDTNEPPMPLPNATIVVVGSTNGTVTNLDGYFEIKAKVGDVIKFSMVGFKDHEAKVTSLSKPLTVSLQEDVEALEEVIVVGETSVQRQHVASSVQTVDIGQQLEGRAVTNLSQSLQGGVTGLNVSMSSGKPGSDGASVNIRGVTTFTNSQPLVLIDGIEMSMDDVNPDDVESMVVLKDAAAAAIYGARAARGVIVITTKRGKPGQVRASYSTYTGIQTPTRLPEFADAATYMRMYNEATINDGGTAVFSQYEINNTQSGLYKVSYPNTNWVDETIDKTSPITSHAVSVRGGNSLARFNLSARYLYQDAMIDKVNAQRMNVRMNSTISMTRNLTLYLDATVSRKVAKEPGNYGSILSSMYQAPPTMISKYPMKGDLGIHYYGIYGGDGAYNPLMYTEQGGESKKITDRSLINLQAKYTLGENWVFKAQGNVLVTSGHNNAARKPFAIYIYETDELMKEWDYSFTSSTSKSYQNTGKVSANYHNSFGGHKLNVLTGSSYLLRGPNATNQLRMASFYGKASYSYNGRYLFEATGRYDGSSYFGDGNKWAFFPSVAVGWNVHKEAFLQNQNVLTYLKLRASWGQTGNDNVGGFYKYDSSIDPKNGVEKTIGNPDIKWETVAMTNLGVDIGLFNKQKIELNVDVYRKITSDLIMTPKITYIAGVGAPKSNVGEVLNEGVEVALNMHEKFGDFKVSLRTGCSYNHNEIQKLAGGRPIISDWDIKEVGHPMNDYYGYKTDGLLTQADIEAGVARFNWQKAGDIKFVDVKKDGKLDENDMMHLGRTIPEFTYFATIRFDYKGIDLSAQFAGVSGVDARYTGRVAYPFYSGGKPQTLHVGNYWTAENPNAYYPRLSLQSKAHEEEVSHDYFLKSGSFLRLRNVQLGYTFKKSILSEIGLRRLRVYANVRNPYVWTELETLDPESRGKDTTYPVMTTYTLGLKVNL